MARPRLKGNNAPPGVYRNKGRWFLRADGREIKLAPDTAPLQQVWDAYLARKKRVVTTGTLEWLCDQYLSSPEFSAKVRSTQIDYENCKRAICNAELKDGTRFGLVPVADIDAPAIAKYREMRREHSMP